MVSAEWSGLKGYLYSFLVRPVDLTKRAPSFENQRLNAQTREFNHGGIAPFLQYLISDQPIDLDAWHDAHSYGVISFAYCGQPISFVVNHGAEGIIRDIVDSKLTLEDAVLDLSKLLAMQGSERNALRAQVKERMSKTFFKRVHSSAGAYRLK